METPQASYVEAGRALGLCFPSTKGEEVGRLIIKRALVNQYVIEKKRKNKGQ